MKLAGYNFVKDYMTAPGVGGSQLAHTTGMAGAAPNMSPAAQARGTYAPMGAKVRATNNSFSAAGQLLGTGNKQRKPGSQSLAMQSNPFLQKVGQGPPAPAKQVMPAVPGSRPPISPSGQVPRGDGTDGPVINDSTVPPLAQYTVRPSTATPQPMSAAQQGAFAPPDKMASDLISAAILCRLAGICQQLKNS